MNSRREQAVALRLAGKSRREIKEILGIAGNSTLDDLLAGVPPLEWTRRPNAKDHLRVKARELRQQGLAYNQIAAELGVSKSSVSLWVRDLPRPEGLSYEECRRRVAEGVRRYWAAERPVREAQREAARAAATAEIGSLSQRELLIAGAIAYWCEGAKNKPYNRHDRVTFINSGPALIYSSCGSSMRQALTGTGPQPRPHPRDRRHDGADASGRSDGRRPGTVPQIGSQAAQPADVRRNAGAEYRRCLRSTSGGARTFTGGSKAGPTRP